MCVQAIVLAKTGPLPPVDYFAQWLRVQTQTHKTVKAKPAMVALPEGACIPQYLANGNSKLSKNGRANA